MQIPTSGLYALSFSLETVMKSDTKSSYFSKFVASFMSLIGTLIANYGNDDNSCY